MEELQGLNDAELKERYIATFAKDPEEGATNEDMIAAIDAHAPAPPAPKDKTEEALELSKDGKHFFGKGDKEKKFPIAKTNKDHVVVRQVNVQQLNGGMVETPNTEAVQTYDKDVYAQLLKDNFFSDSHLKVEVLHEPK